VRELSAEAYRRHESLACIVQAMEVQPQSGGPLPGDLTATVAAALKAGVRPSDAVARLAPAEYAVLAAGTKEGGAGIMATRLRRTLQRVVESAGLGPGVYRVEAAFDEVPNLTYAPVEPMEFLARATSALRGGRRGEP